MLNNDVLNNHVGNRKDLDANYRTGSFAQSMGLGVNTRIPSAGTLLLAGAVGAGLMYILDPEIGSNRRARLVNKSKSKALDLGHKAQDLGHKVAEKGQQIASKVTDTARNVLPGTTDMSMGTDASFAVASSGISTDATRTYGSTGMDSDYGTYGNTNSYGSTYDNSYGRQNSMGLAGTLRDVGSRLPPLLKNKWVLIPAALFLIPAVRSRVFGGISSLRGSVTGSGYATAGMGSEYGSGQSLLSSLGGFFGGLGDRLNQLLGLGTQSAGESISFVEELRVERPVSEVFNFFSNYQNFPQFMRNIVEVEEGSDGISHWTAKGPAGINVSWDARVTDYQPDVLLAWQSLPDATVDNSGRIDFIPNASNGTLVRISFNYTPPAGKVGHMVAKVFASDAQTEMREDLGRVKSFLETGSKDSSQSNMGSGLSSGLSGGLSNQSNGFGSMNDDSSLNVTGSMDDLESRPVTGSTLSSGSRDTTLPI